MIWVHTNKSESGVQNHGDDCENSFCGVVFSLLVLHCWISCTQNKCISREEGVSETLPYLCSLLINNHMVKVTSCLA